MSITYSIAILTHSSLRNMYIEPALKRLSENMNINISIVAIDAVYEEGARIVESMQDKIDLIISGRIHENILKAKAISCPIITLRPRESDIISSVLTASNYDNIISIISPISISESLAKAQPLFDRMGLQINEIICTDTNEIDSILDELIIAGRKVIVGGTLIHEHARKYSELKSVYYYTEEAVTEAVSYALYLLKNKDEFLGIGHLSKLANQIPIGVIIYNANGKIKLLNSIAENIVSCSSDYAEGKDITDIISNFLDEDNPNLVLDIRGKNYSVKLENATLGSSIKILFLKLIDKNNFPNQSLIISKAFITFERIIGHSPKIKNTIALAKQYAVSDETILINGETGVGKDLFAQSIHNYSHRKDGPFWAINCAALPENLLESELFGYEEGAFTGAKKGGKLGYFEIANNGTLFLDEIGEVSLNVQAKLLRVLEQRQILRLGGKHFIPIDVRIICATNRNLFEDVREKKFREDFFYRINVLQLDIPPLRERIEDLPQLIEFIYNKIEQGNKKIHQDVDLILDIFDKYEWPGNVRELENIIRRYIVMKKIFNSRAEMKNYLNNLTFSNQSNKRPELSSVKRNKEVSVDIIKETLDKYKGNKSKAARELNISRVTLWRKLNEGD